MEPGAQGSCDVQFCDLQHGGLQGVSEERKSSGFTPADVNSAHHRLLPARAGGEAAAGEVAVLPGWLSPHLPARSSFWAICVASRNNLSHRHWGQTHIPA